MDIGDSRRVEDLWFDNGTLVLQAESSLFCVYKSILTIRSSVLRGILSTPQAQFMEGCPFLRLDDSADDLTYFLKAVYRPEFFETAQETEFPILAGILRLSTKYNVKGLRQIAMSHLKNAYSVTLETWDKRDVTLPFSPEECPPIAIILLAKEANVSSILPTIMYCCSIRSIVEILDGVNWNGSHFVLSSTDQRACLVARQTLLTSKRRIASTFLNANEGITMCSSRAACNSARLQAVFTNTDDADGCDPLWDRFDWDAYASNVCSVCLAASRTNYQNARAALWADLPNIFNLLPWPRLKAAGAMK